MDNIPKDVRFWVRKYGPILTMALGALFWLWGHHINVSRQQKLDESLAVATQSLQQAEAAVKTSQEELTAVGLWFVPSYLTQAESKLAGARVRIGNDTESGAKFDLVLAKEKNDWSESVLIANRVTVSSTNASNLAKEVHSFLESLKAQRMKVRGDLDAAKKQYVEKTTAFMTASNRLETEKGLYLKKYVSSIQAHRETGEQLLLSAQAALVNAGVFLPPDSDQVHTGDLSMSQEAIDKANALILKLATETQQVTDGLGYQAEAKALAGPTIDKAQARKLALEQHLLDLEKTKGYTRALALSEAYRILEQFAVRDLGTALQYSNTVTAEGIPDLPAAYEAGQQANVMLANALAAADQQAIWQDDAQALIDSYPASLTGLDKIITKAKISRQTLIDYHKSSSWTVVSANIVLAQDLRTTAETDLQFAKTNTALTVQAFQTALANAKDAHAALEQAEALLGDLIQRAVVLEKARSDWPQEFKIAQTEINSAQKYINDLGGYDMSVPRKTLVQASTQLIDAGTSAGQKSWEDAVLGAKNATQTAQSAVAQATTQKNAEDAQATAVSVAATQVSIQATAQQIADDNATRSAIAQATSDQESRNASATRTAEILESNSHSSDSSCCAGSSDVTDDADNDSSAWDNDDTGNDADAWDNDDTGNDADAWSDD